MVVFNSAIIGEGLDDLQPHLEIDRFKPTHEQDIFKYIFIFQAQRFFFVMIGIF
jgi:hypothetical protein